MLQQNKLVILQSPLLFNALMAASFSAKAMIVLPNILVGVRY